MAKWLKDKWSKGKGGRSREEGQGPAAGREAVQCGVGWLRWSGWPARRAARTPDANRARTGRATGEHLGWVIVEQNMRIKQTNQTMRCGGTARAIGGVGGAGGVGGVGRPWRLAALMAVGTLLAAAGSAVGAWGMTGAEPEPKPAAKPDPMSGPKVEPGGGEAAKAPASLVKRDFDGKLERLDRRPEAAALDLLGLTAEERAGADKLLAARAGKVSELLTEHYALFLSLQGARQGGAAAEELRPKMREFREAAGGLVDPPLAQQVAATLPEAKRAEFSRLVGEYIRAMSEEDAATRRGGEPAMEGDRPAARRPERAGAAPMRMELNLLLREVGRTLSAMVTERRERMDELLKAVGASDEQGEKIRRLAREAAAEGGGMNQTEAQRAELARKILDVLTPEQRRKWVEATRGR